MIIRKLFEVETAHIVRNCSTDRCKKTYHGHSAKIEVLFTSDKLDNGGMVLDFGLVKGPIRSFIDAFDHTSLIWCKESEEFKEKIRSMSERWIELPFSPSAENLSLIFHWFIQRIIDNTKFSNGEGDVEVVSVKYHETRTGYAQSEKRDMQHITDVIWGEGIKFSPSIREDLGEELYEKFSLINNFKSLHPFFFKNPVVDQQV